MFRVWNLELRVLGFRVQCLGFGIWSFEFRVQGIWGVEFRAQGVGFMPSVWSLGFRVWGLEFGV